MVRRREPGSLQQAVAIVLGVLMALLITSLAHWGGSAGATGPRTVSLGPYVMNNITTDYSLSFPNCASVDVSWHLVLGVTANFSALYPGDESNTTCSNYSPPSNGTCPSSACGESPYGPPRGATGVACFEQGKEGNCTWTATVSSYVFGLVGYDQLTLEEHGLLIVSFTVVYVTDG